MSQPKKTTETAGISAFFRQALSAEMPPHVEALYIAVITIVLMCISALIGLIVGVSYGVLK